MNRQQLIAQIRGKGSYLCIGLDTDIEKIPIHLLELEDPVFAFNKEIIDATHEFAVAYKPNVAFYEARGWEGWRSLQKTQQYITTKGCFSIADAKRADIGNTSIQYAKAFFSNMDFDALTVAPYMGGDSVQPFLKYKDKWVILLALTSNEGAKDFEWYGAYEGKGGLRVSSPLFWEVIQKSKKWADENQLMYVVGATQAEHISHIRETIPNHFLLVPGVGAQGGDLEEVSANGLIIKDVGLIVNLARSIIYASSGKDFAQAAAAEAIKTQSEMKLFLAKYC